MANWNRRFFALVGSTLYYGASPAELCIEPKLFVRLDDVANFSYATTYDAMTRMPRATLCCILISDRSIAPPPPTQVRARRAVRAHLCTRAPPHAEGEPRRLLRRAAARHAAALGRLARGHARMAAGARRSPPRAAVRADRRRPATRAPRGSHPPPVVRLRADAARSASGARASATSSRTSCSPTPTRGWCTPRWCSCPTRASPGWAMRSRPR